MEFEYKASIFIAEADLDEMARLVAEEGYSFYYAFDKVMGWYDDSDYYNSGYVCEAVQEEVLKRISKLT